LVYGADPFSYDTDFDGVGDGEEVDVREVPTTYDEPIGTNADPNTGAVGIGDVNSGGNAGGPIGVDGSTVGDSTSFGVSVTCRAPGVACDYDVQCCGATVYCCWDGISLRIECTDVTPYGGRCPA
jgi:hypothetical protein